MYNPSYDEARPGTYALILTSTEAASVTIGKLGSLQLQPGFYVYIGSAYDPGGSKPSSGTI